MIVPDTNVVSELIRPAPDRNVSGWFEQQDSDQLYLATPVLAELLFGLKILPSGKRKTLLEIAVISAMETWFGKRFLAFDQHAANTYASVMAETRAAGRPIGILDGQIAAIAEVHRATVATRDTAPFIAAGVPTINPWQL